ncbi:type IX secretion system motor protein PorM/GldM [Arachidicoccus soli]|nr:gliding motility protein GldM [Arachidicoccus soli]
MAIPREPRQKMINLMYLVLTALLALNVSSEILNAFRTVNNSLNNATATIDQKNQTLFTSLQEKLKDPKSHDLAVIWAPKAEQAKQYSDEMYDYIANIKLRLKERSGYHPEKGDTTFREDDVDVPTKILDDGKVGDTLYQKLVAYKKNILTIDPAINAQFQNTLPIDLSMPKVEDKSNRTWAAAYFRMTPTIAAITILSKFQNDIKNSEAQVVEFCHNKIGQVQVVYDEFQALASANTQYLLPGQEFTISAGVGAFSKNAKPTITIDGASIPLNANGMAEYKTTAGSPGNYSKKVNISFLKPDGTRASLVKDIQYTVGSPTGITVSADATRVLYIGLDNPISVGGGNGRGAENMHASLSQGSIISEGHGRFVARVSTPGTVKMRVSDGKSETSVDFRVKTVPTPIAMVGGSKGGRMRVNDFKAQAGVRAELEDFIFEGVRFTVTGYTMTFAGAGYPEFMHKVVNGNSFSSVRDLIERAKPGSTITIDEIRASGPGGSRLLAPIAFNLF